MSILCKLDPSLEFINLGCIRHGFWHIVIYEPKTVKQPLANPQWFATIKQENEALLKNKTWDLIPLPKDKQVLGCK